MHVIAALSAVVVGLTSVAIAPSHKVRVVWYALAAGVLAAGYLSLVMGGRSVFLTVGLTGALSAGAIVGFLRKATPNNALKAEGRR
jgi:hypothetical protein